MGLVADFHAEVDAADASVGLDDAEAPHLHEWRKLRPRGKRLAAGDGDGDGLVEPGVVRGNAFDRLLKPGPAHLVEGLGNGQRLLHREAAIAVEGQVHACTHGLVDLARYF